MKRFFQFYTRLGVKLVRYYFFRPVQLSQSLSGIEMGPGRETLWKMSQTTGVHYYFMIRHFLVFWRELPKLGRHLAGIASWKRLKDGRQFLSFEFVAATLKRGTWPFAVWKVCVRVWEGVEIRVSLSGLAVGAPVGDVALSSPKNAGRKCGSLGAFLKEPRFIFWFCSTHVTFFFVFLHVIWKQRYSIEFYFETSHFEVGGLGGVVYETAVRIHKVLAGLGLLRYTLMKHRRLHILQKWSCVRQDCGRKTFLPKFNDDIDEGQVTR